MAKNRAVDDRTLGILSNMNVDGNVVLPYYDQLPRDQYVALNKVLEALGGKWKRATGHVFDYDPTDRIAAVIATGSYECPKLSDFYRTPEWLAERMIELLDLGTLFRGHVLEPSAGDGALVRPLLARLNGKRDAVRVHVVEAMNEHQEALAALDVDVLGDDFLAYEPGAAVEGGYNRVVMNPPFSKGSDVRHVAHAIKHLREGGRLVAIMSAGITFRQDRATTSLRQMLDTVEPLPEGTFHEAGTDVRTALVTANV